MYTGSNDSFCHVMYMFVVLDNYGSVYITVLNLHAMLCLYDDALYM